MTREYYNFFLILLLTSFTGVLCDESFGLRLTTESLNSKENTQYRFHYFVKDETTGDYKVQEETKEGDSVHGSYTIAEPNGDLRTVTYTAGPGKGFEAKVNVQPNASPVKPVLETTTLKYTTVPNFHHSSEAEKPVTVKAKITNFPGGFTMDVTGKPQNTTEMGMNFSLKTNAVTKTVTEESTQTSLENSKDTETTTHESYDLTADGLQKEEILSTEGRHINEDLVEKEIEDAFGSMPKLPELVLPDNKTHLKFHKDPEEALLDERITQIARQLAETSLRREYEERKLGHIIPISVMPVTTSRYFSKSFKFRPSDGPIQVLNHVNLVPQYIYRGTQLPKFAPYDRIPIIKPVSNGGNLLRPTYDATNTPDFQRIQKTDNPITDFTQGFREPFSVMPVHVPTFLQFISPYATPTIRPVSQQRVEGQISTGLPFKEVTDSISSTSDTTYSKVTAADKMSTKKP